MLNSYFSLQPFDHPLFNLTVNVSRAQSKIVISLFQPHLKTEPFFSHSYTKSPFLHLLNFQSNCSSFLNLLLNSAKIHMKMAHILNTSFISTTKTPSMYRPATLLAQPQFKKPIKIQAKIIEIFMPTLSSIMTEGKILSCVKSEGDKLSKGNK